MYSNFVSIKKLIQLFYSPLTEEPGLPLRLAELEHYIQLEFPGTDHYYMDIDVHVCWGTSLPSAKTINKGQTITI